MKTIIFLFASLGGMMLLFGCKKNNETSSCVISVSTLSGAYIRTAETYQATPTSPVVNALAAEAPCDRDDILTLKANGTYTWTEGATACSSGGTRPNGTWSVNGNTIKTDSDTGEIQSFDCHTLVLKGTVGTAIEITTFVKQ